MEDVAVRAAEAADAGAVAALHAASWRTAYRGILADAFLDGGLEAERSAFWRARLAAPGPVTLLCERDGLLLGFGCLFVDADPRWGSLVDNLHAAPHHRGLGVGRRLLGEMAGRAAQAAPGRPIHLFCLAANRPARGFYERLGGAAVEPLSIAEPDGATHPSVRYAWPEPLVLAGHCRA